MKSGLTEKRTGLTMRIFKGLENIHSVIDRHQAEWLREQGEESERPQRLSVEERIRRSFAETSGTGKFSADRFMSGHAAENQHVKAKEPEPELHNESQSESNSSVEVVNVIPQKDENHSWLYNEVLKAINAAVGDSKNTKVIAIFVPVVQNGKEFESLPVDETITINTAADEAEKEPELEHEEIEIAPSPFIKEPENEPAQETLTEEPEMPQAEQETEQETEEIHEEPAPVPEEHEPATESEQEMPAMGEEFDLIPEGQSEPDAELAEAFQTMEEKLDDNLHEQEQEAYQHEHEETFDEPEEMPVIDEPAEISESESEDIMTVSKGEPLEYEEIELPEPLDDDDVVFDDSVFEDNLNDNDKPDEETDEEDEAEKETIIIEDKNNEKENE